MHAGLARDTANDPVECVSDPEAPAEKRPKTEHASAEVKDRLFWAKHKKLSDEMSNQCIDL
eukprot:5705282-Alexandrium_andersonii.AAC.1